MSRTVKFFSVAIYEGNSKTNISVGDFLDKVGVVNWSERLRKIDGYPTAIRKLEFNEKQPNYRILPFVKYRQDYKPYIGDILSPQDLGEVKKDVIEMVTIVYDDNTSTFAIEGSMHGIKETGIEKYLNTFLPKDQSGNEKYEIVMSPIMSYKGLEDIKRSSQIRSIEISMALSEYQMGVFESSIVEEKERNSVLQSLRGIGKAKDDLDANKVRLVFGVGNGKDKTMEFETALTMLEMLQLNSEHVDMLRVRYRDPETGELDNVDLKNNGGPLKDIIFDNNPASYPGWELVAAEIINTIIHNYGAINEAYNRFKRDLIRISFKDARSFLDNRLILVVEDHYRVISDNKGKKGSYRSG
ncbi:DUF6731 family protein [Halobacillus sp. A5]|uniref:DUF6731 family protein n=1 Tax=Halobacillus sp. A5 TaxID=2880263 RepID=UPI0020A62D59|nr:DUF6731 family protein [Halobacillus sp. A5]MCP3028811.1 hypothetical protein [Halobacillus sp. A5]